MREKELSQGWRLEILPSGSLGEGEAESQSFRAKVPVCQMDAPVPGGVYDALLQAGLLGDPYWRDREDEALGWMEYDFVYRTEFSAPKDWEEGGRFFLSFDSVDTIAWIYCNGILAGRGENMHRSYEF